MREKVLGPEGLPLGRLRGRLRPSIDAGDGATKIRRSIGAQPGSFDEPSGDFRFQERTKIIPDRLGSFRDHAGRYSQIAAERARLKFSSKLLSLARSIHGGNDTVKN